ncbi:hypothetical protein [Mucilaginibacter sp. UR6-11]|uniref:hypothetical protein n=1 Tax=Mucilaginibacter sp. UR6-11 TaxID=1435644 RepID=UPI001E284671|nr:hypothetical protein [Mucilaginibacter sp. UR6-11]MCC8424853.1 hypothetical protein [Mucilaginibacter sp. UR6-11]
MKILIAKQLLPFYRFYTVYINKFQYDPDNYKDSFISLSDKVDGVKLDHAREIIYVFWTGNNDLTDNRRKSLKSLVENAGVAIKLVTPNNLTEYILEEFPLHPAYDYLSLVHKADYLRGYFMLHYGGGYSDIKHCLDSWKNLFIKLNGDDNKWVLGVREKYPGGTIDLDNILGKDLKKYYTILITNGAYIYKPNSPICREWMDEVHRRLDIFFPELVKNPGGIFGGDNYPIPWAYILGHVMQPLILKYNDKVIYRNKKLYSISNYR